jgi:hypothetical protein
MTDVDVDEDDEEEVLKEMFDLDIPRVDAVKGPATGMRFLVLKAEGPQDPKAIARIRKATAADKDKAKGKGTMTNASGDESYPVNNADELTSAIKAVGRGGADHDAIRRHIMGEASKLGLSGQIPDNWNSDGSLKTVAKSKETPMRPSTEAPLAPPENKEPVTKADGDGEDLDASTIPVEPGGGGDPDIPGSQGWESIDSATAQKWTAILSRAKLALEWLGDREGQEVVVTGDGDDADNAWDLQEAKAAVDYAIGVLAAFAVGEATESDLAQSGGVIKAMQTFPVDALEIVEGQGAVKKAGRVLSASNEQAIRDAVASLQNVLSTLPAAPAEEPAQKAQETPMEPPAPTEPLVAAYDATRTLQGVTVASKMLPYDAVKVRKAKGDPMVAVYTADGNLIGAVDPDDLIEMSPGKPVDDTTDDTADGDADTAPEPPAPAAPTAPAPTPAAPAAAIPVAKSETPAPPDPSKIATLLEAAVVEALKPVQEDHDKVVKSLEERVDFLEHRPREGGPLLSGVPGGGMSPAGDALLAARGQGTTEESEVVQNIRKAMTAETDPLKVIELRRVLAAEKIKELQAPRFHRGQ